MFDVIGSYSGVLRPVVVFLLVLDLLLVIVDAFLIVDCINCGMWI